MANYIDWQPTSAPTDVPLQYLTIESSLSPTDRPTLAPTLTGFTQWTTSNAVLPIADGNIGLAYSKRVDPNCIWIVGGTRCPTCLYCYDIIADSISNYDTLLNFVLIMKNHQLLIVDNILYYVTNQRFLTYNFNSGLQTEISGVVSSNSSNIIKTSYK